MAESILDSTTQQALVSEANGIAASRTRGWDNIAQVITTSQVNFLNGGTPLTNEGVRFLDGTPGRFSGTDDRAGAKP
jgi:hypothetical protein